MLNTIIRILFIAIIGGLIGWITNYLAIKLMFRPIEPMNILGFKIQGIIPKRKKEIAFNIGNVIEEELVSLEDVIAEMTTEQNMKPIKDTMKIKIRIVIENKLPSLVPVTIKEMVYSYIDRVIEEEGDRMVIEFLEEVTNDEQNKIKMAKLVESKINSFELEKLEEIIVHIAKNELKHIEYMGIFLGFFIGLVQGIIVTVLV
ncbi:MAG: DUF445 family protein [Andreesenia angusta]|nr:DUF445 family protein [Andreesenia angusta]